MSDKKNRPRLKILKEPKFTEKRNPYKKYQKAKWNWTDIFNEINLSKGEAKIMKNISKKYNINYSTLRNKYSKFLKESNYQKINTENRGTKKIFTDEEDNEIYLFIKNNFIEKNRVICNDIIKIYAKEKFKELHPDEQFNASDGWCNMFKKRWNLSTVKTSISKIASIVYTEDEINIFLNECKDLLANVGSKFFF